MHFPSSDAGYWQASPNPNYFQSLSFLCQTWPPTCSAVFRRVPPNFEIAIERRFLSYAKEKHHTVNTSRKRIGYSRKDDRKSSGQGRVCA
jgi:hypothetical protein